MTARINWRPIPYFRIVLVFILGILFYDYIAPRVSSSILLYSVIISSIFFLISLIRQSNYWSSINLLALVFLGGVYMQASSNTKNANSKLWKEYQNISEFEGVVISEPVTRNSLRLTVKLIKGRNKSQAFGLNGKIITYFKKTDTLANQYSIGDKLLLHGRIEKLKSANNPYAFDFKAYLNNRRIDFQSFISEGGHELISKENSFYINNLAMDMRDYCIQVFEKHLSGRNLAIASAMILGYKNHLDQELYNAYTDSGAVHVLAVSGLHVGIVAMLFMFLFDKVKLESFRFRVLKTMLLIVIISFFALLTGAAPAVTRSALMFSLFIISKYWFPYYNIYNSIAVSAIIMLMIEPNLLYQASFQFSYLALSSIVFFQPKLSQIYYSKCKSVNYVKDLSLLSISAQGFVFPVTIFYFHKFPLYFILSGLIAIPLATIILPVGLILLTIDSFAPIVLIDTLVYALNLLLNLLNSIILGIQRLPSASIDGIWLEWYEMGLLYGIIGFSTLFIITRNKSLIWYASTLLSLFCISKAYENYKISNQTKVVIYDNYKGTLIDIWKERTLFTIKDLTIEESNNTFVAQNLRLKLAPDTIITVEKSYEYKTENILITDSQFVVENQRFLLVDDNSLPTIKENDILIILSSLGHSVIDQINEYPHKEVIICSNLKSKERQFTKSRLNSKNIYDMSISGARIIDY